MSPYEPVYSINDTIRLIYREKENIPRPSGFPEVSERSWRTYISLVLTTPEYWRPENVISLSGLRSSYFRSLKLEVFLNPISLRELDQKELIRLVCLAEMYDYGFCIQRNHDFFYDTESIIQKIKDKDIAKKQEEVQRLRSLPYKEYLKTDHWRDTRNDALYSAEEKCQLCSSADQLNVHHRTYDNLGCEHSRDLTVLCSVCHSAFHNTFPKWSGK